MFSPNNSPNNSPTPTQPKDIPSLRRTASTSDIGRRPVSKPIITGREKANSSESSPSSASSPNKRRVKSLPTTLSSSPAQDSPLKENQSKRKKDRIKSASNSVQEGNRYRPLRNEFDPLPPISPEQNSEEKTNGKNGVKSAFNSVGVGNGHKSSQKTYASLQKKPGDKSYKDALYGILLEEFSKDLKILRNQKELEDYKCDFSLQKAVRVSIDHIFGDSIYYFIFCRILAALSGENSWIAGSNLPQDRIVYHNNVLHGFLKRLLDQMEDNQIKGIRCNGKVIQSTHSKQVKNRDESIPVFAILCLGKEKVPKHLPKIPIEALQDALPNFVHAESDNRIVVLCPARYDNFLDPNIGKTKEDFLQKWFKDLAELLEKKEFQKYRKNIRIDLDALISSDGKPLPLGFNFYGLKDLLLEPEELASLKQKYASVEKCLDEHIGTPEYGPYLTSLMAEEIRNEIIRQTSLKLDQFKKAKEAAVAPLANTATANNTTKNTTSLASNGVAEEAKTTTARTTTAHLLKGGLLGGAPNLVQASASRPASNKHRSNTETFRDEKNDFVTAVVPTARGPMTVQFPNGIEAADFVNRLNAGKDKKEYANSSKQRPTSAVAQAQHMDTHNPALMYPSLDIPLRDRNQGQNSCSQESSKSKSGKGYQVDDDGLQQDRDRETQQSPPVYAF